MRLGAVAVFLFSSLAMAQTQAITSGEAKSLLKSASSPEDHLKLAQYYRQAARSEVAASRAQDRPVGKVARRDEKKAAEEEKLANMMRTQPPPTRAHPSR